MNNSDLIGYLTDDVQLNHTNNGTSVANVTLAVPRPYKDKNGKQHTDYPDVVIWGKQAEILNKYESHKGDQIGIGGRLQTRTYTNKNNETVFVTEVVARSDGLTLLNHKSADSPRAPKGKNTDSKRFKKLGISDKDLPF